MEQHSTHDLSERILQKIEQEEIRPKPAWHFLLHDTVIWVVAVVAFVVGGMATALTLYIHDASRFMVRALTLSDLGALVQLVPVFWLVLFGAALFYGVHAVRETRRGYRYNTKWLIVGAVCCSIGAGALVNAAGLSEHIDRYLLAEVPLYRPLTGFEPLHWTSTSSGVVAGIVESAGDDRFLLRTIDEVVLEVRTSTGTEILLPRGLHDGARVRVVGSATGTDTSLEYIEADEIAPFRGRGPQHGGSGVQGMRNGPMDGTGTGRAGRMRE